MKYSDTPFRFWLLIAVTAVVVVTVIHRARPYESMQLGTPSSKIQQRTNNYGLRSEASLEFRNSSLGKLAQNASKLYNKVIVLSAYS